MRIASWNVNSVRMRLPNVLDWLSKQQPDVLLLQELKCQDEQFPYDDLKAAGYEAAVHGQKSWNGVAILSKTPITDVRKGFDGDEPEAQSRYIEATVNGIRVASIYLPNGNPVGTEKFSYKLDWMNSLIAHAKTLLAAEVPAVLGGDYNIIPEARDCFDPTVWIDDALFRLDSRLQFRTFQNLGMTDAFRVFNDKDQQYTFWDYQAGSWPRNLGIRIDHMMLTPQAADRLQSCTIDAEPRGLEKASDHTPILVEIKL